MQKLYVDTRACSHNDILYKVIELFILCEEYLTLTTLGISSISSKKKTLEA